MNFVYCAGGSQASERFSTATAINTAHVTPSCMIQKAPFTISSLRPRIRYTLRENLPGGTMFHKHPPKKETSVCWCLNWSIQACCAQFN